VSSGGALLIDATGATFTALNVYSNQGSGQAAGQPIVRITADNADFDQPVIELRSDSTSAPNVRVVGGGKEFQIHAKNNRLIISAGNEGGALTEVLSLDITRPSVTGSISLGTALTSLLTELANLKLIDNNTVP